MGLRYANCLRIRGIKIQDQKTEENSRSMWSCTRQWPSLLSTLWTCLHFVKKKGNTTPSSTKHQQSKLSFSSVIWLSQSKLSGQNPNFNRTTSPGRQPSNRTTCAGIQGGLSFLNKRTLNPRFTAGRSATNQPLSTRIFMQ